MIAAGKRQARAAEYRALAIAAGVLAETSLLAHVREKHQRAAARWTDLALLNEQPIALPPPQALRPGRANKDTSCIT